MSWCLRGVSLLSLAGSMDSPRSERHSWRTCYVHSSLMSAGVCSNSPCAGRATRRHRSTIADEPECATHSPPVFRRGPTEWGVCRMQAGVVDSRRSDLPPSKTKTQNYDRTSLPRKNTLKKHIKIPANPRPRRKLFCMMVQLLYHHAK